MPQFDFGVSDLLGQLDQMADLGFKTAVPDDTENPKLLGVVQSKTQTAALDPNDPRFPILAIVDNKSIK